MTQSTAEGRQELVDTVAAATREIGSALGSLGAAYEQLDEHTADVLEEKLFRPVQLAYGRGRRIHTEFTARHGLVARKIEPPGPGLPSTGVRGFIDNAVAAVGRADNALSTLQDSMLPVDVGDPPLRAALAELRELIGVIEPRAREILRTLGR